MRQRRLRKAEEAALRKTLLSHESGGDFARANYDYPEALNQYGEALRSPVVQSDDEWRLCSKYADVLFCSHEPEKTGPWLERALRSCRSSKAAQNAGSIISILMRLARQCWLNAQTVSALAPIGEAIQVATAAKDKVLVARANLQMTSYLALLGRNRAAKPYFEQARHVLNTKDPAWRSIYLSRRAIRRAMQGERAPAYRDFEAGVKAPNEIQELARGYWVTAVWDDYGIWAMALGDIATAQFCRERALFVAREYHVAWRIPYLSLRYADLLLELEQYERARELVLDALTYDCKAPCIKILTALIGIRLAGTLNDDGLLHRCSDEHVLEYAYRSGEPAHIGPLISALARMHIARGEAAEATALVRQALPTLSSAEHAWDLLVDVAMLGDEDEQQLARAHLQSRVALPSSRVATAYLHMFDAAVAKRSGSVAQQRLLARQAAKCFKRIGWLAHERLALRHGDDTSAGSQIEPPPRAFRTMLGGLSELTKRESDVAELVLQGFSNRAIARELSISEHTVESHMSSIMNRLGIHSRHQLTNMVADSGM